MPAQMPPTRWISGESRRTRIMSMSGAIPSWRTPRTVPVTSSGLVPLLTVRPWTGSPALAVAGAGQACEPAELAGAAPMPATASAATVAATLAWVSGCLLPRRGRRDRNMASPRSLREPPWQTALDGSCTLCWPAREMLRAGFSSTVSFSGGEPIGRDGGRPFQGGEDRCRTFPTAGRGEQSPLAAGQFAPGHRRVAQSFRVHVLPQQTPDAVRGVPVVDLHAGEDRSGLQPERREDAAVDISAEHYVVVAVGADVPDVLHAEVVRVGDAVRLSVVAHRLTRHAPPGGLALLDRGVPVLHPESPPQRWMGGVGHVAGGIDGGVGGAQRGVDHDAVVGLDAGLLGEARVRRDTDADDDQVPIYGGTVAEAYDGMVAVLLDAVDGDRRTEVHPVLGMHGREDARHLRAENSEQRKLERLQHGDRAVGHARGGGDLQADPATPDDDQPSLLRQRVLQPVAVLDRAEVRHGCAAVVGESEAPRCRAGREQESVVGLAGTALHQHATVLAVQRGDRRVQSQVDVV